jgi:hypothetical protein
MSANLTCHVTTFGYLRAEGSEIKRCKPGPNAE